MHTPKECTPAKCGSPNLVFLFDEQFPARLSSIFMVDLLETATCRFMVA